MFYLFISLIFVFPPVRAQTDTSPWSGDVLGKTYTKDVRPDYLLYEFTFSLLAIEKYGIDAVPGYTCRALIAGGYAPVGKFGNIEMRSADPANPNWRYFRDLPCCSLEATQPCPGCYRHDENSQLSGRRAVLRIHAVINGERVQVLATMLCLYCVQYACAAGFCANGEVSHFHDRTTIQQLTSILVQYANSLSILDPVTDLETEKLTCTTCAPGTWNTCKYKESCKW